TRRARHSGEPPLRLPLDGGPAGLRLPAEVACPLVLDREPQLHGRYRWSRTRSSAICTAFSAAPLPTLSSAIQQARPFSVDGSARMRPTWIASEPVTSTGVG